MAVQVNDIVAVLCKLLDCCCPIQPIVVTIILYVDSISLVRNDEILHIIVHTCIICSQIRSV